MTLAAIFESAQDYVVFGGAVVAIILRYEGMRSRIKRLEEQHGEHKEKIEKIDKLARETHDDMVEIKADIKVIKNMVETRLGGGGRQDRH